MTRSGHGHHSSNSSWGDWGRSYNNSSSWGHNRHHHRTDYGSSYTTSSVMYGRRSSGSCDDLCCARPSPTSHRPQNRSNGSCCLCCSFTVVGVYLLCFLCFVLSWSSGGTFDLDSGETAKLWSLPCQHIPESACFLQSIQITGGAGGPLEGVQIRGFDRTPPRKRDLRVRRFHAVTTVEADSYTYFSWNLNRGGSVSCAVDGDGVYVLTFPSRRRFEDWADDSGVHSWRSRYWVSGRRSFLLPAASDGEFFVAVDNDFWWSDATAHLSCEIANVDFDLRRGARWGCDDDLCDVPLHEGGGMVFVEAPESDGRDAEFELEWEGVVDWGVVFNQHVLPACGFLVAAVVINKIGGMCGRRKVSRLETAAAAMEAEAHAETEEAALLRPTAPVYAVPVAQYT
ncbi:hypothetical protein TeGR_g9222 [Tetraparma gracilis]|uniref:Uncharacterized protein n=1 Tax=Tetraparma gracilis TaxID=2962635 RepID=A0ABQ6MP06_9STRA|nr:hypothetical protein TeGR_g9222 [Tetraparma gracilis]